MILINNERCQQPMRTQKQPGGNNQQSVVPAIVVHANPVQPRFASFIKLNFAANRRLPKELAGLQILEDDGSGPDVLHGVADRLQVPLCSPCVGIWLIVHVVVNQAHLSVPTTLQE